MHTEGEKPGRVNLIRDYRPGFSVFSGNHIGHKERIDDNEMGFSHFGRIL